jgi:hypothetical protein
VGGTLGGTFLNHSLALLPCCYQCLVAIDCLQRITCFDPALLRSMPL